jgi:curved DNA-binding protein CbpA
MDIKRSLEILELESVTSPEELKQAYRDMAKIWHPDRFHDNPRLQDIASAKLTKINEAYNTLLGYFDPEQRKRLKSSASPYQDRSSGFSERKHPEYQSSAQTEAFSDVNPNTGRINPDLPGSVRVYPAKKKSLLGKLFGLLALCIFLVISGAVVYFILNMDRLKAGSINAASKAMEKVKTELEKKLADQLGEKGKLHPNTKIPKSDIIDLSKETKSGKSITYFEIYLEGDTVLMTESWWQEGDMIMYTQFGGSMGVEKSRVKRIVEREAARSDLPF